MKKIAFLIDDGIVLKGTLENHRFVPDENNCGFHYQIVAEADLGKTNFFDEKIAQTIANHCEGTLREYVVELKTDRWHDDYKKIIHAQNEKEALDRIANDLYLKHSVGVFHLYDILEEVFDSEIEEFFKNENIIQCGNDAQYVKLISIKEFRR